MAEVVRRALGALRLLQRGLNNLLNMIFIYNEPELIFGLTNVCHQENNIFTKK